MSHDAAVAASIEANRRLWNAWTDVHVGPAAERGSRVSTVCGSSSSTST